MNDMQHIEQLPLVFVNPLHLNVEQPSGIEFDFAFAPHKLGQTLLVAAARGHETAGEFAVPGIFLKGFQFVQLTNPAVADRFGDQIAQAAIAMGQPTPRRDAVGLAVELLGPQFEEIAEQRLGEQFAVQRRDAVDRETADDAEKGHADDGLVAAADDRHARAPLPVSGPSILDQGEKTRVDFVNDIEQARQQLFEQADPPDFQRFRQQGVVGIGHAIRCDFPGFVPAQPMFVHEQAHQFGNGHRGMGVVQLEHAFFREAFKVRAMVAPPAPDHILQAGRGEKVLLAQTQFLAGFAGVVGIEHHGDLFGEILLRDRVGIAAGVEFLKVEFIGGLGLPQTQGINRIVAVAGNRQIVRNGEHIEGIDPVHAQFASLVVALFKPAEEFHPPAGIGTFDLPGIAAAQPGVGLFDLIAVLDRLAEHAVFIADAVAGHRNFKRGATVEEAGGQTSESAVAETGVHLLAFQVFEFAGVSLDRRAHLVGNAQVEQGVGQGAAHQKFHGQIAHALDLVFPVALAGSAPATDHAVAHGNRERGIQIVMGFADFIPTKREFEMASQVPADVRGGIERRVRQVIHELTLLHHSAGNIAQPPRRPSLLDTGPPLNHPAAPIPAASASRSPYRPPR